MYHNSQNLISLLSWLANTDKRSLVIIYKESEKPIGIPKSYSKFLTEGN